MKVIRRQDLIVAAVVSAVTLTSAHAQSDATDVPEIRPGLLMGYLPKEALPNSLALLPPPPPAGSAAFALDDDVARKSVALRGTARWTQAAVDADLSFPHAAGIFACALNAPITEERTPRLYLLLRRTLTDAGLSTYAAKDHYQRTRPFMANKESICTPSEQAEIEKDGSYPSGHTAVGWAWALILSEIAPAQTDAILARGAAYGESATSATSIGIATWCRVRPLALASWRDCMRNPHSALTWKQPNPSWRPFVHRTSASATTAPEKLPHC